MVIWSIIDRWLGQLAGDRKPGAGRQIDHRHREILVETLRFRPPDADVGDEAGVAEKPLGRGGRLHLVLGEGR